MKQAINAFKAAHAEKVKSAQRVKDLWTEYQALDENVKGKKKIMKQRAAAIIRTGTLSQKSNIAERKMIEAILNS